MNAIKERFVIHHMNDVRKEPRAQSDLQKHIAKQLGSGTTDFKPMGEAEEPVAKRAKVEVD